MLIFTSLSGACSAEKLEQLFHDFSADSGQTEAVDERVEGRIQQHKRVTEISKTPSESCRLGSCNDCAHAHVGEVADQEKHADPHHGGRCSPVPRHVQCVSRLLLRLVGSLGLNLLSSQTAVDLDAGDKNDEKSDSNDNTRTYIPYLTIQPREECKSRASPDDGEHCTHSPGRHNLLVLEVEE